jgi:hypothetical protein
MIVLSFWREVQTEREAQLEQKVKLAQTALTKARTNRKLKCLHCGLDNKVKKLIVYTKMFWNHNTGSPSGGYYVPSHDYYIQCPKCEKESRYFEHMQKGDNWEWKKVHSYLPWFKKRRTRYPEGEMR